MELLKYEDLHTIKFANNDVKEFSELEAIVGIMIQYKDDVYIVQNLAWKLEP